MAEVTLEGIYENGIVKLVRRPRGVKRARVRVTFLSDVGTELEQATESVQPLSASYPSALREEYKALIHKKMRRIITPSEAVRLDIVREQINRIDAISPVAEAWEHRANKTDQEIEALRRELESLPDAQ